MGESDVIVVDTGTYTVINGTYVPREILMGKSKDKVLMHYFKVAVAQDPTASDMGVAQRALAAVKGVEDVAYLRSAMKIVED